MLGSCNSKAYSTANFVRLNVTTTVENIKLTEVQFKAAHGLSLPSGAKFEIIIIILKIKSNHFFLF